jgi:hypothetical protein
LQQNKHRHSNPKLQTTNQEDENSVAGDGGYSSVIKGGMGFVGFTN